MRNYNQVLNDLENISKKKNFLETVIYLSHINLNSTAENIHKRDFKVLLNENEITFLLGLWLKNWNKDHGVIINIKNESTIIHLLMNELHSTFLENFNVKESLTSEDFHNSQRNNPEVLKEMIFYSGTGAYDLQYTEFIAEKYALDEDWLIKKYNIKLNEVIDLYTHIKIALNIKINKYRYSTENLIDLYTIDFNSYLFELDPNFKNILDLFSVDFQFQGYNLNFRDIGDYNEFKTKPIIRTQNSYIIPLPSLLATALNENFFYWMLEDDDYKKTALKNRGIVAEKIVFNSLKKKFPENVILCDVLVKQSREITLTDLDILMQKDDKLIIFQIKSKKLTQLSKQGNVEKYKKDFEQSITQAYEQAIKPYYHLYNEKCKLLLKNGKEIKIERPNKIHSLCIVLDSFPSLNSHIRLFYNVNKEAPIALSIFDLDTLLNYLDDFDKLFDYLNIRNEMMGKLFSEEEISLVQAFISGKLVNRKDYDYMFFDNSFAQQFDKTYYLPLLSKHNKIFHQLIKNIKPTNYCFCGSGKIFKNCCQL